MLKLRSCRTCSGTFSEQMHPPGYVTTAFNPGKILPVKDSLARLGARNEGVVNIGLCPDSRGSVSSVVKQLKNAVRQAMEQLRAGSLHESCLI